MNFTSFQEGDKLTIALTGEIDHHCAKTYIRKPVCWISGM